MLLGVIADDFTGASDIANTIAKGLIEGTEAKGGLRTTQYLGVPRAAASSDVEAGVVSLKSRSIPAPDAVRQSLDALEWLRAQGCRQFVFKYCSTFDSTPDGNIGPVAEALAEALDVRGVVVCPAFPGAGRTLYRGHLFVHDRLLSESGMQSHPLNPMTDPDIRRFLARQARGPVGLVSSPTVRSGTVALRAALEDAAGRGETLVVVDAICDEDLVTIGRASADARLLTGGSGIAIGLPANFIRAGLASGSGRPDIRVAGPEAILAGSCSGATLGQIDVHARDHPVLAIDVDSVMRDETQSSDIVAFLSDRHGKAPLAFSSATPDEVGRLQARYGRDTVARKLDALFADTARRLVEGGVKRLVVAGGETSGAVVSALNLGALAIGPEIDPGVPVLFGENGELAIALKSGNFGAPDFFEKALRLMGDPA